MTDILRFLSALPPGVVVRPGVDFSLVGVCCTPVEVDLDGSGVLDGVRRSLETFFRGPRELLN